MIKVIAIVGPTSVGKTALGVAVAKAVGGEVVSADSRQVYRGLNIGTGKMTKKEMRGVPHHLLDVANPKRTFTAAEYVRLGRAVIAEIATRGRVPVVVGGTGFYIDALLGRARLAATPPDARLRAALRVQSMEKLQETLRKLDPERYKTIDLKNRRRLERAIEISRSPACKNTMIYHSVPYEVLWIGLTLERAELKKRIHKRLIERLEAGMLEEAKRLHARGLSWRRMEELGLEYRYLARHLRGALSRDEMLTELERAIGRYVKRQMAWFRKNKSIRWCTSDQTAEILAAVRYFAKPQPPSKNPSR